MQTQLIYTTWPSDESAKTAAKTLLGDRLIACANILPSVSVYSWEGELREEKEVVMLLKTSSLIVQKTIDKLLAIHPYTNPCLLTLPVNGGSSEFIKWVDVQTSI